MALPIASVLSWEDLLSLSINEAKFLQKQDMSILYQEQIMQDDLENQQLIEKKKKEGMIKMIDDYLPIQQRKLLKTCC